jgi:hypothetical protein
MQTKPEGVAPVERGLAGYVRAVATELGVPEWATGCEVNEIMIAYLALAHRCPEHPHHDLMLIWGEQDGWLAALETLPTQPVVVAYLGHDIVPEPSVVTAFVKDLVAGRRPGRLGPPGFRRSGAHDDLAERLARYS